MCKFDMGRRESVLMLEEIPHEILYQTGKTRNMSSDLDLTTLRYLTSP